MTCQELLAWYESLVEEVARIPTYMSGNQVFYNQTEIYSWVARASSAIEAVFPESTQIRRSWQELRKEIYPANKFSFAKLFGHFQGAFRMLSEGRIGTLIDAIRVETESEVLTQAEELLAAGHVIAAAVLAGGALETHLKYLSEKHGIRVVGSPSITKYNNAIQAANKKMQSPIYSNADVDFINGWGKMRNVAAHQPIEFKCSDEQVGCMINGIRSFIARIT